MDDDSFTEKLLQRSKARREYLNVKKTWNSNTISRKRSVLGADYGNVPEDPSKRQCLDFPSEKNEKENVDMEEDNKQDFFVPFKVASNIQGLAALRKKDVTDTLNDFNDINEGVNDSKESEQIKKSLSKPLNVPRSGELINSTIEQILKNEETIKKVNKTDEKTTCTNYNEIGSNRSFVKNASVDPVSLPLSARKALFEKAAISHSVKLNEPAFHPKLSVAQRTAIFENASKSRYKPAVNLRVPKRFVTPTSTNTSSVDVRRSPDHIDSNPRESAAGNVQANDLSVQETLTLPVDESMPAPSEDFNIHSYHTVQQSRECISTDSQCKFHKNTATKPLQKVLGSTATHSQQQKTEIASSTSQQHFVESVIDAQQEKPEIPSTILQQTFVEGVIDAQQQKTEILSNISQENFMLDDVFDSQQQEIEITYNNSQPNLIESSVIDSQHQEMEIPSGNSQQSFIQDSTTSSQQQSVENVTNSQSVEIESKVVVNGKEVSNLVNRWEKLSSSTSYGNSNSEGDCSTRQSERSSINAYEFDEEQTDYESELESEYNEKESMSDCNEKDEESVKDLSLSDHDSAAAEQDVFNPQVFSDEAGLSNFDVETDSFPATDDETGSYSGQSGQHAVSDTLNPADSISLKSSISESSSYNDSRSQTHSRSSLTSIQETEDILEEEKTSIGGSSSSFGSPLVYTVSFYRKQKLGTRTTPTQTIKRPLSPSEEVNQTQMIQQHIKLLQEDILRQQTVIGQTSQALNLCHATTEFSGSSEQVEAERLLLIATQKRQACMNEIQRLKSQGGQGELIADGTGTLIITDLHLPLKREFITSQLEGKINNVYYFLCLIRHAAQVIVTQMVSTSDKITNGALYFSNHIKLQNLPPDFSICFEVYTLQTKKENLPHDQKYHIKREHSKLRLTPKGKKSENKILLPAISSPGGPNAVRSPSFHVMGYTRFSVQNCNKNCFTLDEVPFASPLEGVLKVKLRLHAEHNTAEKGFLTMFEDVSGYGAWHRRWCSLESHQLAYWKYPDDEQRKAPIGMIDLRQCVTGQVKLAPRDICARPNTFKLVVVRPMEEGDKNTLISQSVNTLTTTKHLLSADTKEERMVWCNKLNEALTNVRKWDPSALRPVEDKLE